MGKNLEGGRTIDLDWNEGPRRQVVSGGVLGWQLDTANSERTRLPVLVPLLLASCQALIQVARLVSNLDTVQVL